jgi:hypothetical protein
MGNRRHLTFLPEILAEMTGWRVAFPSWCSSQ